MSVTRVWTLTQIRSDIPKQITRLCKDSTTTLLKEVLLQAGMLAPKRTSISLTKNDRNSKVSEMSRALAARASNEIQTLSSTRTVRVCMTVKKYSRPGKIYRGNWGRWVIVTSRDWIRPAASLIAKPSLRQVFSSHQHQSMETYNQNIKCFTKELSHRQNLHRHIDHSYCLSKVSTLQKSQRNLIKRVIEKVCQIVLCKFTDCRLSLSWPRTWSIKTLLTRITLSEALLRLVSISKGHQSLDCKRDWMISGIPIVVRRTMSWAPRSLHPKTPTTN